MKFAKSQILERIKKPKNSQIVEQGKRYESRLRIFTEPKFKKGLEEETAWKDFKKFMTTVISAEKEVKISEFIQYPLTVCSISEGLMSDIYKVFNAGNSYFNIETVKKNGGEKLQKTLEKINLNRWIEEQGKKVLKNKPNTIVVIDKDDDGEPYLIPVTNDRLIDVEIADDGVSIEYITFIHSQKENDEGEIETRVALYDAETYSVVLKSKEGTYTLESHVKHGLDYCPARTFLKDKLNSNGGLNRKSPLSLVLSKLQEWQLFDIYKFFTDHYAPFPIVEMARSECGNSDCKKGVIYTEEVYFADDERKVVAKTEPCPICADNHKIGIGTKIMIDPIEGDEKSAGGVFKMISNDITNLEYIAKKLQNIEEYVKLKVVGIDNIITKEAVNEKQVEGSFESKTNVLLNIKTNLDELYEWIARTVAKLKIGEKPINVTANFGTEWYLVGEEEIQARFKVAKEIGLPRAEVDMLYYQLIETKYKGNPNKIARLKIINKLNPCPYDLLKDKIIKAEKGVISQKELFISERLIIFVNKFELQHGSIVEFGENLTEDEQIKRITNIINKYTDEYIKESKTELANSSKKTNE